MSGLGRVAFDGVMWNDRSLRPTYGSAGSAICDIAKELASESESLARSLQNLHLEFDSRGRTVPNSREIPDGPGQSQVDLCKRSRSASSRRRIFPDAVRGTLSMNSISRTRL